MDNLIMKLKNKYNLIIIPREKSQIEHYDQSRFEGITILRKPEPLSEIVKKCSLFIGAGGTMTREMAVIGIPTISVYQEELLKVDQYLIDTGAMVHKKELTAEEIDEYFNDRMVTKNNNDILLKGRSTYNKIKSLLLNIGIQDL